MFPKLFIACLQSIFSKMKWNEISYGFKVTDNYLNNLRFADNIVLLAKDPQELQATVKELHTESGRIGKMNKTKTKTPSANTTTQSNIVVENESLDKVDQYTYLGQNIHANEGPKQEVQRRVAVTRGKFGKLSQYLQNQKFSLALKKRIFMQSVMPTLLYVAETLTFTKTLGSKIRLGVGWACGESYR